MSSAPNALLPLSSCSKRSGFSREQARYQGLGWSAVAGNSFPEAPRPTFEATISGDPDYGARGKRASGPRDRVRAPARSYLTLPSRAFILAPSS